MSNDSPATRRRPALWFAAAVVAVGATSGVTGMLVLLGLHAVQHLVYGTTETPTNPGLAAAAWQLRLGALVAAGIVAGVGWWAIRTFARPVVSVAGAVAGARMPWFSTTVHVGLQVVTVGLGASIGREVAPRELGAAFGGQVSSWFRLDERERRVLVACGAAAALSAVYDIPLAGAVFALEVLLGTFDAASTSAAIVTSVIASQLAHLVVPPAPLYLVHPVSTGWALGPVALGVGLVVGAAGAGFGAACAWLEKHRPRGIHQLWTMPVAFTLVGVVAIWLPEVLGNGRAAASVAFAGAPALVLLVLGVAKAVTTTGTIASGAAGGTLTPSVAVGGTLGGAAGWACSSVLPGVDPVACALLGATAFLTATMAAPVTALLITIEFTAAPLAMVAPLLVATGVSIVVTLAAKRYAAARAVARADLVGQAAD